MMNGLTLRAKSTSACRALHAARYPCVCKAQYAHSAAPAATRNVIAKLSQYPQQPRFTSRSAEAIPCAATRTPLATVENT